MAVQLSAVQFLELLHDPEDLQEPWHIRFGEHSLVASLAAYKNVLVHRDGSFTVSYIKRPVLTRSRSTGSSSSSSNKA
jgi:hypothetical protein